MKIKLKGLIEAQFLERKSRFVCECLLDDKRVTCHLPNSGRLLEILKRGAKVYVTERSDTKLRFRMVLAEKDGKKVLIDTGLTNKIAEAFINSGFCKAYENFKVERREVTFGKRRFDLLLKDGARKLLVEVKNSTLFRSKISMFPDCETSRGRSHVEELLKLKRDGIDGSFMFLVSSPDVEYFMPDFHNDLLFFKSILDAKDELKITSYAFAIDDDFSIGYVRELDIPWELLGKIREDSGVYMVIIELPHESEIHVGSLGNILFPEGYYVYVGKAERNLKMRMERHKKRKDKLFWHIDFFTTKFRPKSFFPIIGDSGWECELAERLNGICDFLIEGFGSSDCGCASHLFGFKGDPLARSEFIDLLLYFRVGKFEEALKSNGLNF